MKKNLISTYLEFAIWSLLFTIVSFVVEKIYRVEKSYERSIFWNGIRKIFTIITIALFWTYYFT